jgi:hypothetical protein
MAADRALVMASQVCVAGEAFSYQFRPCLAPRIGKEHIFVSLLAQFPVPSPHHALHPRPIGAIVPGTELQQGLRAPAFPFWEVEMRFRTETPGRFACLTLAPLAASA